MEIGSDDGSIIRHNTLPDGACDFNLRCGIIAIGSSDTDDAGRGTVVQDNILGEVSVGGGNGAATIASSDYNLVINGSRRGANDLRGRPTYSGGGRPSALLGFKLATGSLGKGNASDGTDRGAAIGVADRPRCVRTAGRRPGRVRHRGPPRPVGEAPRPQARHLGAPAPRPARPRDHEGTRAREVPPHPAAVGPHHPAPARAR